MRVRPTEIEVPKDCPFKNDLLDRKPAIEELSDLLGGIVGPCVVALDSEWGGGKSTFLRMWAAHLQNEGHAVTEFNAWETDYSGDPFIALSSQFQDQFGKDSPKNLPEATERFAAAAKGVALRSIPALVRLATYGIVDVGTLGEEIGSQIASFSENKLDEYRQGQASISNFQSVMQDEANSLSERHGGRPLFVMIDELDRCRPSYAVELLEVAKHLFSVDKVIFVLAINRSELTHAVKALYGINFDADGYLYRFFDIDYIMPKPDRLQFVIEGLSTTEIDAYVWDSSNPLRHFLRMITLLLAQSNLDLRRISQTIRRLALVTTSKNKTNSGLVYSAALSLVLRAINPELYAGFRDCTMKDSDIIKTIYDDGILGNLKGTEEGALLEAMIAIGQVELSGKYFGHRDPYGVSRLLASHNAILDARRTAISRSHQTGPAPDFSEEEEAHFRRSTTVLAAVNHLVGIYSSKLDFRTAIRRVELLPVKS